MLGLRGASFQSTTPNLARPLARLPSRPSIYVQSQEILRSWVLLWYAARVLWCCLEDLEALLTLLVELQDCGNIAAPASASRVRKWILTMACPLPLVRQVAIDQASIQLQLSGV